ncbi:MAG TPA: nuclear transport factor 2 family protein [Acidimicrobiales bacterium]|nr:nuclear transport factor 2 family protein [Acidimicrobiales bacterium]
MNVAESPRDTARRLADEAAILAAVHRYCRGVDRADAELTRSAYHPDATDDHGAFKGPAHEFAERVNAAHATRWSSTMHVVANHSAVVRGDAADAETYVIAYLRRLDGGHLDVVGGRYIDRFERRHGQWRIARRVYVCEWTAAVPTAGSLIDAGAYVPGRRDRHDPSYSGMLSEPGAPADG